jgi:hypothetical protein
LWSVEILTSMGIWETNTHACPLESRSPQAGWRGEQHRHHLTVLLRVNHRHRHSGQVPHYSPMKSYGKRKRRTKHVSILEVVAVAECGRRYVLRLPLPAYARTGQWWV